MLLLILKVICRVLTKRRDWLIKNLNHQARYVRRLIYLLLIRLPSLITVLEELTIAEGMNSPRTMTMTITMATIFQEDRRNRSRLKYRRPTSEARAVSETSRLLRLSCAEKKMKRAPRSGRMNVRCATSVEHNKTRVSTNRTIRRIHTIPTKTCRRTATPTTAFVKAHTTWEASQCLQRNRGRYGTTPSGR